MGALAAEAPEDTTGVPRGIPQARSVRTGGPMFHVKHRLLRDELLHRDDGWGSGAGRRARSKPTTLTPTSQRRAMFHVKHRLRGSGPPRVGKPGSERRPGPERRPGRRGSWPPFRPISAVPRRPRRSGARLELPDRSVTRPMTRGSSDRSPTPSRAAWSGFRRGERCRARRGSAPRAGRRRRPRRARPRSPRAGVASRPRRSPPARSRLSAG